MCKTNKGRGSSCREGVWLNFAREAAQEMIIMATGYPAAQAMIQLDIYRFEFNYDTCTVNIWAWCKTSVLNAVGIQISMKPQLVNNYEHDEDYPVLHFHRTSADCSLRGKSIGIKL